MDIILASGSPRRRELLTQIGVKDYRILVPDVDEHTDVPAQPSPLVEVLSRRKAEAVRAIAGNEALIIAADTVVALDNEVLGKPTDKADATRMLSALSGREHQVYTGFTVLQGDKVITAHEVTDVTFRPLSSEEIEHYIATNEPMDKAGAYGIQGFGAVLVSGLHGDYFNVMGLPVYRLAQALSHFGIDTLALASQSVSL
jgi:septum formation protein